MDNMNAHESTPQPNPEKAAEVKAVNTEDTSNAAVIAGEFPAVKVDTSTLQTEQIPVAEGLPSPEMKTETLPRVEDAAEGTDRHIEASLSNQPQQSDSSIGEPVSQKTPFSMPKNEMAEHKSQEIINLDNIKEFALPNAAGKYKVICMSDGKLILGSDNIPHSELVSLVKNDKNVLVAAATLVQRGRTGHTFVLLGTSSELKTSDSSADFAQLSDEQQKKLRETIAAEIKKKFPNQELDIAVV